MTGSEGKPQKVEAENSLHASARSAARPSRSFRGLIWQRFLEHKLALWSLIFLIILLVGTLAAPIIEGMLGFDSEVVDLFAAKLSPGLEGHILGTDELGRDLLLRLLYGGQVSLLTGISAALCAAIIGSIVGLFAGYYGGWIDGLLMRTTDGVIALPLLPLLIVLAALDLEKLGLPSSIANSQLVPGV